MAIDLISERQSDLTKYAQILGRYLDPEMQRYTIFPRPRANPKTKRIEGRQIVEEKRALEEKLGIKWKWLGSGRWRLQMDDADERPGSQWCDEGFWWAFPIYSHNREDLDYLANDALPNSINGKKFTVQDTYIPCDGNVGWDCA